MYNTPWTCSITARSIRLPRFSSFKALSKPPHHVVKKKKNPHQSPHPSTPLKPQTQFHTRSPKPRPPPRPFPSLLRTPMASSSRATSSRRSVFDAAYIRSEFSAAGISGHFIPLIWKYASLRQITGARHYPARLPPFLQVASSIYIFFSV